SNVGEPFDQRGEGDLTFEAGQGGAETGVDASAEREVLPGSPGDVEPVRVVDEVGVAVGGGGHYVQRFTALDLLAAEFQILAREPRQRHLDRAVVPQDYLDRRLDVLYRVTLEQVKLVRMLEEGEHPIADQVDGRL